MAPVTLASVVSSPVWLEASPSKTALRRESNFQPRLFADKGVSLNESCEYEKLEIKKTIKI